MTPSELCRTMVGPAFPNNRQLQVWGHHNLKFVCHHRDHDIWEDETEELRSGTRWGMISGNGIKECRWVGRQVVQEFLK